MEAMSAENVELLASLKGKLRAVGPSARSEALLRLVLGFGLGTYLEIGLWKFNSTNESTPEISNPQFPNKSQIQIQFPNHDPTPAPVT